MTRWLVFASLLVTVAAGAAEDPDEALRRHRNLGKAFYENPATQYDAVGELEKAWKLAPSSARDRLNYGMALLRAGQVEEGIAQLEAVQKADPSLPHTWFNLGIAYKRQSEYAKALAQFERMVDLVPDEPISHYNLGVLYKLEGQPDDAVRHFERAAALDPNLAGPHFQLATAYRQAKRADEAKRAMATFRELKQRNAGAAVEEDLEWSWYAELYDPIAPADSTLDATPRALAFETTTLVESGATALAAIDLGGDGSIEMLVATATGIVAFDASGARRPVGLDGLAGVTSITRGDLDNDGLADLALLVDGRPRLVRQQGDGRFAPIDAALPAGPFNALLLADHDHDYDLDLVLLGKASTVVRHQADGTWQERPDALPWVAGEAIAGVVFDLVADSQGIDLAVAYAGRPGVLYRDRLGGRYEAVPLKQVPAGSRSLSAHDLDHDGWTDLAVDVGGSVALLVNTQEHDFRRGATVPGGGPINWADLGRRGAGDLVAAAGVHRALGVGRFGDAARPDGWPSDPRSMVATDLDADGRIDLAILGDDGAARLLRNRSEAVGQWIGIALQGTKNLQLASGSEVEVRTGARYQKWLYDGLPLVVGLGEHAVVDTVRVTWPNGLIQNETRQPAGEMHRYVEAQRLSGSCPMIYTWNGHEFEFITDVLGVAPLGASVGDGQYFPVDHDEVIQVAGESLVARDGALEVRIVEELREVAFLDHVHLVAVDHPVSIDIFTNDKFKGPPFPEHRLFGVGERHYPTTARDHRGRDVRERLVARDQSYVDGFERRRDGTAERHHVELDFGDVAPDGRAILVLSGWVDWADGSTFLGTSQGDGPGLVMPSLEVRDPEGRWRTVIEDMGIPAGKPKTIVVDLTDRFLSASREVRIASSLVVFWDEIFLGEDPSPPEVRSTRLDPASADLRFGGFSEVVIHPTRAQPERFVYAKRLPMDRWAWNPTPGLYTRYGDVRPLLATIDDRLVVMGAGDELRLRFSAADLPAVPAGWRRDYLLVVDGWAKDGDANTAHSQTVGPLPYHAMPQYPYAPPHHYPDSDEHTLYREHYLTRPALRLVRPLAGDAR